MMIIQIPNRASIEPSHKIVSVLIIVLIVVISVLLFLNIPDKYSAEIYENSNDIEEIFNDNKAEFVETINLLKKSDFANFLHLKNQKAIFNPTILKRANIFSEKEYEQIYSFMNKYKPYEIGKSNGDFYFVFLSKNIDVTIYYTERTDESLLNFLNAISQDANMTKNDNSWYIKTQPSGMDR